MIDLLEEGFDLAIRPNVPPDSSLMVRQLADWHQVLCCSPSYLETHPQPMSPADLSGHNCIRHAFYPFGDEWRFTNPDGRPITVRVAGNLVTRSPTAIPITVLCCGTSVKSLLSLRSRMTYAAKQKWRFPQTARRGYVWDVRNVLSGTAAR